MELTRYSVVLILALSAMIAQPSAGQQFHRQGFESNQTHLKQGLTNGQIELLDHGVVEDMVHSGKRAERLAFRVTSGDFALVDYAIPPTFIIEELEISAYVSATRPGTQIYARAVFPREKDPATGETLITLLPGTVYDTQNRFRKLVITRLDKALDKQKQLLQAQQARSLDARGAYVDRIVFNVAGPPGEFELRVDDIVAGPLVPVPEAGGEAPVNAPEAESLPASIQGEDGQRPHATRPEIADRQELLRASVRGSQLFVGSKAFFPRGIVRTQDSMSDCRQSGFNLVLETAPFPPARIEEASRLGMLVVPMLPLPAPGENGIGFASAAEVGSTFDDASIFFYVGGPLDQQGFVHAKSSIDSMRADQRLRQRPLAADIGDGIRDFSREIEMVGTARFPLMTSMDLADYQRWIHERRALAVPTAFLWSWIQTHPPREMTRMVYGHDLDDRAFDLPVGPAPDQVRLVTYSTLAAGTKGILFTSDRWLSEAAQGRARRLQLSLLNTELMMIEPFLAEAALPSIRSTSHPNIEVAIFRHSGGRGVLALAYWKKQATQYVVGQASANNVQFIVPGAEASQAIEISPVEVRGLKRRRDNGGIRVTIPEFDTVAFVVLTTDTSLYSHYQEIVQQVAPQASRQHVELAKIVLESTATIDARLEAAGHPNKEAATLLSEARRELEQSEQAINASDSRLAYTSASRSLRFARLLQELHWRAAVPVPNAAPTSPFAVSFYTLADHYRFIDHAKRARFSQNMLASGGFEVSTNLDAAGWSFDPYSPDSVRSDALLVTERPREGARCLRLAVAPTTPEDKPLVLENTRVTVASPAVAVEPGQVARLSGYIRIAADLEASVDGAMLWDSLGGESLALRFKKQSDWQRFEIMRPIRQSGEIRLLMMLTALGTVEFDDVSIEVSQPASVATSPAPSAK